jgi:hypothetical protein
VTTSGVGAGSVASGTKGVGSKVGVAGGGVGVAVLSAVGLGCAFGAIGRRQPLSVLASSTPAASHVRGHLSVNGGE